MSDRIPFRVSPMLASLVPKPFHQSGWVYEEKYDGYRILAYKEGAKVTLLSRNNLDRTATFAAVATAVGQLRERTALLDGEVVAFDAKRVSRFQLLQRGDVAQAFAVFDCIYCGGRDLRREPLSRRRDELESVLEKSPKQLLISRRLAKDGLTAYDIAKRKGFEGIVAKDSDVALRRAPLQKMAQGQGRIRRKSSSSPASPHPTGGRESISARCCSAPIDGKDLHFVGKVGTGFTEQTLAALAKTFRPLGGDAPRLVSIRRARRASTWLAPRLVAQIAFQEWTADRKLRQPVFLGLRDDKKATDCILPKNFS